MHTPTKDYLDSISPNPSEESPRGEEMEVPCGFSGRFRMVVIGTRFWIRLHDMSNFMHLPADSIHHLLDRVRVISKDERVGHDKDHPTEDHIKYVEFDTISKLLKLSLEGRNLISDMKDWMEDDLFPSFQETVSAGTLHRSLSPHEEFVTWARKSDSNKEFNLFRMTRDYSSRNDPNLQIPVEVALKVALRAQCFEGAMTYCLLADGGYLHGGPWGESPEDSLKRFHEMMPDRQERVNRRKIYEFQESRGSTCYYRPSTETKEACEKPFMTMSEAQLSFLIVHGTTKDSLKKFRKI
jgi:hypothetical protein